uniref:Uncharacterized protein n=1 Tax=Timema douglasi TaxID=61478 RepID=A0A7R8VNC5_TIMDO|nr:unnamed protein product [Timema douglasi]
MAPSFVAADNLLSAGIVLPNPAGSSLPSPLQDSTNDKRRKWVRPSCPLQLKIQEVVRPQPHFLVMSRVYDALSCMKLDGGCKAGWDPDAVGFRHVWDGPAKVFHSICTLRPFEHSYGVSQGTLPQPKRPRTAEDFLLFCQYILDYVNYDETKTEEVVVEKTENSIGDDESSPNSVKSESAISSATEDDRKSSDTDSGKNYSDIDTGHKFGWFNPFLSKGAHVGFIHAVMRTPDFITLSAIRSIATAMATTSILVGLFSDVHLS